MIKVEASKLKMNLTRTKQKPKSNLNKLHKLKRQIKVHFNIIKILSIMTRKKIILQKHSRLRRKIKVH